MSNFKAWILFVFFAITFFSSNAVLLSATFGYSDELLVLFSLLFSLTGKGYKSGEIKVLLLLVVFWVYVILMSFSSPYYRGLQLTILDLILFSKPIILFVALLNIPSDVIRKLVSLMMPLMLGYLIFALVFYFVDLAFGLFPVFDRRFGIASYSFLSSNPGEFSNLVFVAGIFVYSISNKKWVRILSASSMVYLSLLSLRFKAIVLAAIYTLLILVRRLGLIEYKSVPSVNDFIFVNRIKLSYLLAVIPVSLLLGAEQFSSYFLGDVTPRLFMVQSSLQVATDYFPFGAGAGTFGSAMSKAYYSSLYYDLGFDGRWGLSESDTRFLSDNFWPMVLAQYGVIGLLMSIYIYTMAVKLFIRGWVFNYRLSIGIILILSNIIISTIGSAILIGSLGAILILALLVLYREGVNYRVLLEYEKR